MTVCVAAICQHNGVHCVIGASDRMVTAGDVQFEQNQSKIYPIRSGIQVLIAGDLGLQGELLQRLRVKVDAQLVNREAEPLEIREVAFLLYSEVEELRRWKAAEAILHPLALDYDMLVSSRVSPDLANQLAKEILAFDISPIEALVIGCDPTGAHIYMIDNKGLTCQDWTAFAAIGAGAWHANSQMMFMGHVRSKNIPETALEVFIAKRRAEVAPGVGEQTDMVFVEPPGTAIEVGGPFLEELKNTYDTIKQAAEEVRGNENAKLVKFFEELAIEVPTEPESKQSQQVDGQIDKV